jgi:hypothetical protein
MTKPKIIILMALQYASAFVHPNQWQSRRDKLRSGIHATESPLVVAGTIHEALGAAMARCARDVMLHPELIDRTSPIPLAQPIAFYNTNQSKERLTSETIASLQNGIQFLGPNLDNYEQILSNSLHLLSRVDGDEPMLYTSVEFGTETGARQMKALSMVQSRFAFMGLNLNTNDIMSREDADHWGSKLQSLFDGAKISSAAISMDVRTHLAMLQSNSLPRCRGVLGDKDRWAIQGAINGGVHIDSCDGLMFEYQYNYNDPFGGCDPLLCPSMGYIVPIASAGQGLSREASSAYAAAYSTNVGLGLDHLSSICIATSVKSVFAELGRPPVYSWKTIDDIVQRSAQVGKNIRREDGLPRKMYKEIGYR